MLDDYNQQRLDNSDETEELRAQIQSCHVELKMLTMKHQDAMNQKKDILKQYEQKVADI